ncbi:MAG: hypothetical protein ACXVA9_05670 [Bdellovibrionales bacterium]
MGSTAFADRSSCLPEFNSLQTQQVLDLGSAAQDTLELKSENSQGIFVSKARMSYTLDPASKQLQLRFHFDDKFDGVSLPHNLYSVLIVQNGSVVGWLDFTSQCQGPGVGFFPGQSFRPPALKLSGEGKQNFQFVVWGRIN